MNMPLTIRVKLNKVGNSLKITVPVEILRALNWKEGDLLELGLDDHHMIVTREKKE
jgi:antitoxin component of MazEF toxin-antitoxin module